MIEGQKRKNAEKKCKERHENLYRSLISHLVGIVYCIAELHLGYKPDLTKRD